MTRREAIEIIYRVIHAEVLDPQDEIELSEVADAICEDDLLPCGPEDRDEYCDTCPHLYPY